MCIRDRQGPDKQYAVATFDEAYEEILTRIHKLRMKFTANEEIVQNVDPVSYTHLRAHETVLDLVCRLLLEKKQQEKKKKKKSHKSQISYISK